MDDMEDELLMVTGRGSKAAGKKRGRKLDDGDEEAGGKAGNKRGRAGNDSDEDDGMDEEERRKLESMNELEREMYLYEREEQLQRARQRQSVLDQTRGRDEQVCAGLGGGSIGVVTFSSSEAG